MNATLWMESWGAQRLIPDGHQHEVKPPQPLHRGQRFCKFCSERENRTDLSWTPHTPGQLKPFGDVHVLWLSSSICMPCVSVHVCVCETLQTGVIEMDEAAQRASVRSEVTLSLLLSCIRGVRDGESEKVLTRSALILFDLVALKTLGRVG